MALQPTDRERPFKEFIVPIAGHFKTLYVSGYGSTCGHIRGTGVGFEFDSDGGWVMDLSDLKEIVAMAEDRK